MDGRDARTLPKAGYRDCAVSYTHLDVYKRQHDRDFAVIEDALIEMMEKYPQVMLKLVGVLSEDKMKRFQDRIEKMGFMEWQKLPEALAGVDINLMPLENTVFHSCKSENKWMEAALVKVPSVMSRNNELEPLIQNGVEGYLCSTKDVYKRQVYNQCGCDLFQGPDSDYQYISAGGYLADTNYVGFRPYG